MYTRSGAPKAAEMVRTSYSQKIVFALAGWLVVGAFMLPFLWMVVGSFKTTLDFLSYPPVWLFSPTLDNYRQVFVDNTFLHYLLNSTIVAVGSTVVGGNRCRAARSAHGARNRIPYSALCAVS